MTTTVVPPTVNATEATDVATEETVEEASESEDAETSEESKESSKDSKEDKEEKAEENSKSEEKSEDSKGSNDSKDEDSEKKDESEDEESKDDADKEDESDKDKEESEEEEDQECEITYPMIDFDKDYSKGGSWGTEVTVKGGAFKISYSGQYAEKVLGLPEGIKGKQVKAVKVNIKKGDVQRFTVKLRNEGEEVKPAYGSSLAYSFWKNVIDEYTSNNNKFEDGIFIFESFNK